jgi:hypothetical protein
MAKNVASQSAQEIDQARAWQELAVRIGSLAEANPVEAFDIASVVVDAIANATSADEIFAANESGPADMADYLNQTLNLTDARFAPSAERFRKGTLGFYVVFDAVDAYGGKVTISCGAPNVVASLFRLWELRFFGDGVKTFPVSIRGRDTANGQLYTVHAG